MTAPAVLLAEQPGRLRLELQDPVGGLLALLVVSEGRFWLYQHDSPEISTGPLARVPRAILPVGNLGDVTAMFLAHPPADKLRKAALSGESATWDGGKISWKGGLAEPTEWSVNDGSTVSAEYDDYEFKEGLRYPTKIRISRQFPGTDKKEVLLVWKDWEPSVRAEKKLFQIPQQETFGRKIKVLR